MRLLLFFWLFIFIKSSFSFVQLYPNYNLTLIRVRRIFREPRAPYPTAPLFAEAYLNNYYNPYIKGLVVFQQTVTITLALLYSIDLVLFFCFSRLFFIFILIQISLMELEYMV